MLVGLLDEESALPYKLEAGELARELAHDLPPDMAGPFLARLGEAGVDG